MYMAKPSPCSLGLPDVAQAAVVKQRNCRATVAPGAPVHAAGPEAPGGRGVDRSSHACSGVLLGFVLLFRRRVERHAAGPEPIDERR